MDASTRHLDVVESDSVSRYHDVFQLEGVVADATHFKVVGSGLNRVDVIIAIEVGGTTGHVFIAFLQNDIGKGNRFASLVGDGAFQSSPRCPREGAPSLVVVPEHGHIEERSVGGEREIEQDDAACAYFLWITHKQVGIGKGAKRFARAEERLHVEFFPRVVGKNLKRGIIHASEQGGCRGSSVGILDGQLPGFLGARFELIAKCGEAHVQVEVVVWHQDGFRFRIETVFLGEGHKDIERATVFFGHHVGQILDFVAHLNPLVETDVVAVVDDFNPHCHVVGRTAQRNMQRVARMRGSFVDFKPFQCLLWHFV